MFPPLDGFVVLTVNVLLTAKVDWLHTCEKELNLSANSNVIKRILLKFFICFKIEMVRKYYCLIKT
jgi:hypothetical protein